jgi:hypothetical protein
MQQRRKEIHMATIQIARRDLSVLAKEREADFKVSFSRILKSAGMLWTSKIHLACGHREPSLAAFTFPVFLL